MPRAAAVAPMETHGMTKFPVGSVIELSVIVAIVVHVFAVIFPDDFLAPYWTYRMPFIMKLLFCSSTNPLAGVNPVNGVTVNIRFKRRKERIPLEEKIARLNKRLHNIRGNDPISRARREALILEIYRLMNGN